jgi:hypothetical protein
VTYVISEVDSRDLAGVVEVEESSLLEATIKRRPVKKQQAEMIYCVLQLF